MEIRSLLHYEIIKRNVYTKANWVTIIRGLLRYEMMKSNVYTKAKKAEICFYLESHGQSFVAPPMWRQDRAQKVRAVRAHQLSGVIRQHVHHRAVLHGPPVSQRARCAHARTLAHFCAGEWGGGRREPSARARVYGNMHHNRFTNETPLKVLTPVEVGWGLSPWWWVPKPPS